MDENIQQANLQRGSRKMLGLPVYSIQEGNNLGNIKGFILDAQEKSLLAFVVERRRVSKEEKMLPFTAVNSIGEDAVTVEHLNALERRGANPVIMNALRRPIQPLGARCFTAGGKTLGKVEEYYIDAESGKISQLEINSRGLLKGNILVDGAYIIALAPHTIMLRDEALTSYQTTENQLLNSMEAAKDFAGEITRTTASVLGSSFHKIISGKEERGLEDEAAEVVTAKDQPPAVAVPEPLPEPAPEPEPASPPLLQNENEAESPNSITPIQPAAEPAAATEAAEDVMADDELNLLPLSGKPPAPLVPEPLAEDDLELILPQKPKPKASSSKLLSISVLTPEEAAQEEGFSISSGILDIARAAAESGLENTDDLEDEAGSKAPKILAAKPIKEPGAIIASPEQDTPQKLSTEAIAPTPAATNTIADKASSEPKSPQQIKATTHKATRKKKKSKKK